MKDLWEPIDVAAWQATPCISGRTATRADVAQGIAVFVLEPSGGARVSPVDMKLPAYGRQIQADERRIPVVIIQAENASGQTLLGVRYLTGGNGVCMPHEVEILDGPDDRKEQR